MTAKTNNAERQLFMLFVLLKFIFRFQGSRPFVDITANTSYPHSFVQLGNYDNKPFVTGSFESSDENNKKTEIYYPDLNVWKTKEEWDYPSGRL